MNEGYKTLRNNILHIEGTLLLNVQCVTLSIQSGAFQMNTCDMFPSEY